MISFDLDAAAAGRPAPPVELVPEAADTLIGAALAGQTILAEYLVDASARIRRFALDGAADAVREGFCGRGVEAVCERLPGQRL